MTRLDLSAVLASTVGGEIKGMPGDVAHLAVAEIGRQGWDLLAERLPLPLLVLNASALENNLTVMQRWADQRGLLLAPHAKTTMAPQLLDKQLALGAYALTVASVQQAQVLRRFGAPRLVIANQVVGDPAVRFLCHELASHPEFEVFSWVDSAAGVEELTRMAASVPPGRALQVLVEIGWAGGRTGTRSEADVDAVTAAIERSGGAVELVGVALYEGLLHIAAGLSVTDFLDHAVATASRLRGKGHLPERYLLSGAGSTAYDLVAEAFAASGDSPRMMIRPGCYITHDHGLNERLSPLGRTARRASADDGQLQPALELWTYVHSTPEPGLALLTLGRRDAPFDAGFPVPTGLVRRGTRTIEPLSDAEVTGLNDQHCYLRHDSHLAVGDRVLLGISHPCGAFDRWQVIAVVDDSYRIVDAVRTYF